MDKKDWEGRLETLKKIKRNEELDIEEQNLYIEALERKIKELEENIKEE